MAFILLIALHSSSFCTRRQHNESEQETDAAEKQTDQEKRLGFIQISSWSSSACSSAGTRNAKGSSGSGTMPLETACFNIHSDQRWERCCSLWIATAVYKPADVFGNPE